MRHTSRKQFVRSIVKMKVFVGVIVCALALVIQVESFGGFIPFSRFLNRPAPRRQRRETNVEERQYGNNKQNNNNNNNNNWNLANNPALNQWFDPVNSPVVQLGSDLNKLNQEAYQNYQQWLRKNQEATNRFVKRWTDTVQKTPWANQWLSSSNNNGFGSGSFGSINPGGPIANPFNPPLFGATPNGPNRVGVFANTFLPNNGR